MDLECSLCGSNNPTLKHILNGCYTALQQGRYTWRHDKILKCITTCLKNWIVNLSSRMVVESGIVSLFTTFVKEGEKGIGKKKKE